MNRVLYIKASPRTDGSYSIAVADAFVDSYRRTHPSDEIRTIDIFQVELPAFDYSGATAKYKVMHAEEHTKEDQEVWAGIVSVIEEFKSADKYVMAVPMWNFSIPYRLKQYIDVIVQPTYTFSVTKDGNYEGLVKDKLLFIAYARGGTYEPGTNTEAFDMQKQYLELIMSFIGLSDIRSVVVEPTLAGGPDVARRSREEAISKARQIAEEF